MIIAIAYVIALMAISWVILGDPTPEIAANGTWFYAGLAMVVLSAALAEPFFATPAQALSNAIAAMLLLIAFPKDSGLGRGLQADDILLGKVGLLLATAALIVLSIAAIFLKDNASTLSARLARLASRFGSAKVVYSAIFIASAYALHAQSSGTLMILLMAWFTILFIRPLEALAAVTWRRGDDFAHPVGKVIGLRNPGLAEVQLKGNSASPEQTLRIGALTSARLLEIAPLESGTWGLASLDGEPVRVGDSVYLPDSSAEPTEVIVGPAEPGTTLTDLVLRTPGESKHLEEGALVSSQIRDQEVLFQVIAATAKSESTTEELEHRFLEIIASKIGSWDEERKRFQQVAWLPAPGSRVKAIPPAITSFQRPCIGCLPNSNYGLEIDPDTLVTHNAAILGILGVGKTYLALELIRRIIVADIKVVVLDITGEYAPHFREIYPEWYANDSWDGIASSIFDTVDQVHKDVHKGGNVSEFREALRSDLSAFISSDYRLKIYDPAAFKVTRQDSRIFNDDAAIAPLTIVEVGRIVVEELLSIVSDKLSKKARVCVVLEEAHSIAPEWNSTSYSADQQASNGLAKAVLQGRKYGIGVLLVTQRTANVTKTILNQCNTVFALRSFDATGMEFLRNYVGAAYTDVLSSLKDRTAVVFGKASSCPTPVIVRLNEHDEMLNGFWNDEVGKIPKPESSRPPIQDFG